MRDLVEDGRQPAIGARFVLLSNLPALGGGSGRTHAAELVTWRLVAGNNRSLGKAAVLFDSVASCLAAATRLHHGVARSKASVEFHAGAVETASFWSWTVSLEDEPVARSTHNYSRRLECLRAQSNFLDAVGATLPVSLPVRRLGRRLGACTV